MQWEVRCDASTQDIECELNDEVAADFVFKLPKKTVRYRLYMQQMDDGEEFDQFRDRLFNRFSTRVAALDGRDVADELISLLKGSSDYQKKAQPSRSKPWNAYDTNK